MILFDNLGIFLSKLASMEFSLQWTMNMKLYVLLYMSLLLNVKLIAVKKKDKFGYIKVCSEGKQNKQIKSPN